MHLLYVKYASKTKGRKGSTSNFRTPLMSGWEDDVRFLTDSNKSGVPVANSSIAIEIIIVM